MRLNDIWRNVSSEIGFYTKETFNKIPLTPGVYAWFYPLRVLTKDPYEFIDQVNAVLNYDCKTRGKPEINISTSMGWQDLDQTININFPRPELKEHLKIWKEYTRSKNKYNKLRSVIMKASIFIPPLYVGKTNNLIVRCKQHLIGSANNDFHNRYETYARKLGLSAETVADLLFVCIRTEDTLMGKENSKLEDLVESILKNLAKPKYSKI